MSPVTVCGTPSIVTKIVVVLLVVHPVTLMLFSGRRRRHTLASTIVPVVLIPLFIGMSGTLLTVARVMQGAAISGGGRGSRSAGVAEALLTTVIASAVGAVAAAIALVQEVVARMRGKQDPLDHSAQQGLQIASVCAAMIVLALTLGLVWMTVNNPVTRNEYRIALISASITAGAALCTWAWLVALKRRDVGLQPRFAIAASLIGAGACVVTSVGTWQYLQYFTRIALGG